MLSLFYFPFTPLPLVGFLNIAMHFFVFVVAFLASITFAAPLRPRHNKSGNSGFPSAQEVKTLLGQINTTLSSGNPALDAGRQAVVQGLFDARRAVQKLARQNTDSAQANEVLADLLIAQGGADRIEAAVERNATADPADQLDVAKGLFLANATLAALPNAGDAQKAVEEALAGGEAVLAAQGVDLTQLETAVLGSVVDPG